MDKAKARVAVNQDLPQDIQRMRATARHIAQHDGVTATTSADSLVENIEALRSGIDYIGKLEGYARLARDLLLDLRVLAIAANDMVTLVRIDKLVQELEKVCP